MYSRNSRHIQRGCGVGRRGGALALAVFAMLVLASVLPTFGRFGPIAAVVTGGHGDGPPASDIAPLREFTATQVVEVAYTAYLLGRGGGGGDGDGGSQGVSAQGLGTADVGALAIDCTKARDWTELYYRTTSDGKWALYAPPWNPCGHWIGSKVPGSEDVVNGTIPFDSLFTGGEGPYEFATVSVHHRNDREPMPDQAKAHTTVDYHPPTLFLASPVADAWTNQDLLTWDAQDAASGVAAVTVALDGAAPVPLGSASGSKALGIAEGSHDLVVTATDRAGNHADVSLSFHFDPTAPTLAFTGPSRDGFVASRDVSVTWTAVAQGAPLTNLRLTIDGGSPMELPTNATSYALTGLAERRHVVGLLAIDAAGNLATDTLGFGVDVSPPTLTVVEPSRPFANTPDLRLFWITSENGSGIDRVELSLDGGTVVRVPDSVGYEFPQISEASHSVRLRAVDRAGNVGEATVSVTVDRTPPTVSLTEPTGGVTVYGTIEFAWTAADDRSGIDPDQTYFVYDEIGPARASGTTKATVSATQVGPHFALVRVMDRAGNPAEAGVAFTYGGPTPPGPLGISALDFSLLILIILAIAVVAAYVAVRRRRRLRTS